MLDHERPLSREALAVAGVPRGQHAVEEIHALADRFDQILWLAHAHEIAWLRRRQARCDARRQCVHERLGLADGHSADGVAVEAQRHRLGDGALAHIVPGATLNDPEQRSLARALGVGRLRAAGPAQGQCERALRCLSRGRIGQALVEGMDDVGAERVLDLDGPLGCEEMRGSVDR